VGVVAKMFMRTLRSTRKPPQKILATPLLLMNWLAILTLSLVFLSSKLLVRISIDVNLGILALIPCMPLSLRGVLEHPEHPLDTPL
jgi:hypothetical protein